MVDLKLNRVAAGILIGALMMTAACSPREDAPGSPTITGTTETGTANSPTADASEAASPVAAPLESASPDPAAESVMSDEWQPLPERLRSELALEYPEEDRFAEWLRSWAEQDNPGDYPVTVIRADLDGDGLEREWASVVYESRIMEDVEYRYAYGIVAALNDGEYEWQSFVFPAEDYGRAKIEQIGDLNGDGKPEIVWASLGIGAHTSTFTYTASEWEDGKLNNLPGAAIIPSVTEAGIQGGKLRISGGLIHSVGAGPWQREYTDTYTVADGALKRESRVFAEAATPYHLLLDGLWAEADGDAKRAIRQYKAAASLKVESYLDYAFVFGGEWVEGGTLKDEEKKFEEIVRRFAEFRKERLEALSRGEIEERACASATKKSGYDASWIAYLNAPAGYANPVWSDETVCSAIAERI
ncbi:hypothetical protein [Cohnella sp.]|uniref:hypothetical protein n=1 Tax=Cohnella sp. TaxID=1883426 RepID=UPI0035644AEE